MEKLSLASVVLRAFWAIFEDNNARSRCLFVAVRCLFDLKLGVEVRTGVISCSFWFTKAKNKNFDFWALFSKMCRWLASFSGHPGRFLVVCGR